MADQFRPKPEHKFTLGLWTVGNVSRDPFGKPVGSDLRHACSLSRRSIMLRPIPTMQT